jgi:hypothetical protein
VDFILLDKELRKLYFRGATYAECTVVNVSVGGLYISLGGEQQKTRIHTPLDNEATGNRATVDLAVPGAVKPPAPVTVKIRFISAAGVGVEFAREQPDVLDYLSGFRKPRDAALSVPQYEQPERQAGPGMELSAFLDQVRDLLFSFIGDNFARFFAKAQDELLELANHPKSNSEQTDLFHALTTLEKNKKKIELNYLSSVEFGIGSLTRRKQVRQGGGRMPNSNQGMDLVSKDEFDDWVQVVGIARAVDSKHAERLQHFEKSLTYMAKVHINNESNPVAPYFLLWSLKKTLEPFGLAAVAKGVIYQAFQNEFLINIESLYTEIESFLKEHGISDIVGWSKSQRRNLKKGKKRAGSSATGALWEPSPR